LLNMRLQTKSIVLHELRDRQSVLLVLLLLALICRRCLARGQWAVSWDIDMLELPLAHLVIAMELALIRAMRLIMATVSSSTIVPGVHTGALLALTARVGWIGWDLCGAFLAFATVVSPSMRVLSKSDVHC